MTSLSVLNRKNRTGRAPKKLMLLGGGRERLLILWSVVSRSADRWFKTRLSVYGWALYFGALHESLDTSTWWNVCVRCGSGCASGTLERLGVVKGRLIRHYACPTCGAPNIFTRD